MKLKPKSNKSALLEEANKTAPSEEEHSKKIVLTHSEDIVNRRLGSLLESIVVKVVGKSVPENTISTRRFIFFVQTSDLIEFRISAYRQLENNNKKVADPDQVYREVQLYSVFIYLNNMKNIFRLSRSQDYG